jgi:hypothetical protein
MKALILVRIVTFPLIGPLSKNGRLTNGFRDKYKRGSGTMEAERPCHRRRHNKRRRWKLGGGIDICSRGSACRKVPTKDDCCCQTKDLRSDEASPRATRTRCRSKKIGYPIQPIRITYCAKSKWRSVDTPIWPIGVTQRNNFAINHSFLGQLARAVTIAPYIPLKSLSLRERRWTLPPALNAMQRYP